MGALESHIQRQGKMLARVCTISIGVVCLLNIATWLFLINFGRAASFFIGDGDPLPRSFPPAFGLSVQQTDGPLYLFISILLLVCSIFFCVVLFVLRTLFLAYKEERLEEGEEDIEGDERDDVVIISSLDAPGRL